MSLNLMLAVQEGEACGLLFALKWLHESEIEESVVELDCKAVVDQWILQVHSAAMDFTEVGNLVATIKTILSFNPRIKVGYVKRLPIL